MWKNLKLLEYTGRDTHTNMKRAGFNPESKVRRDMEAICDRRCAVLRFVLIEAMQVVVAINSDAGHDRFRPKPLPTFSGHTEIKSDKKCTDHGILEIEFSTVVALKVYYNKEKQMFEGLSFFGRGDNNCLATAKFRRPIYNAQSPLTLSMNLLQYVAAGIFTADLLFLSTFFGHMGQSAKHPCIFCLALLDSMKSLFEPNQVDPRERTLDDVLVRYQLYQSMYSDKKEHEKNAKQKREATQVFTHSISLPPLANIHFDCVSRAMMHVFLGWTRLLVTMIMNFNAKVESMLLGHDSGKTRAGIQRQLDQVKKYEQWLEAQLEGTKLAIAAQEEQTSLFMARISRIAQVLSIDSLSQHDRSMWEEKLRVIEGEFNQWEQSNAEIEGEEEDHKFHVLEQLGVVKQTRQELTSLLKHHEGFSHRIVVKILKKYGVDMKLYHEGMIIGNHCITFAKNGILIMRDITNEMKAEMQNNESLKVSLDNFETLMTRITSKWFEVVNTIKSTRRLSSREIGKYKADVEQLRQAVVDLVKHKPPIPGENNPIEFPTTRKTHILFGKDSEKQLDDWGTFGGVDEENTETVQVAFN